MKVRKLVRLLFLCLLTAAAVLFFGMAWVRMERAQGSLLERLQAKITIENEEWVINTYYDDKDQIWYLFFPSCTDAGEVSLSVPSLTKCTLDGQNVEDGQSLENLPWDQVCEIRLKNYFEEEEGKICLKKSENLPAVFLTLDHGISFINEDQENQDQGYFQIVTEEGQSQHLQKIDAINGRGNTSWIVEKKSYRMKLAEETDVLGMGQAKDWILQANYYDGSYMRNKIVFDAAISMGYPYNCQSAFIDLYVDGEYMGLYQLAEKVEVGENRIDIGTGYLLEIDYPERLAEDDLFFTLENEQPILIHSPEGISQEQVNALDAFWQEIETAIYQEDFKNPQTGKDIFEYLDLQSWAWRYVMEELLEDLDMGVTSHYLYIPDFSLEGKVYEGPLWDMDNTLGRGGGDVLAVYARNRNLSTNNLSRFYARLCQEPRFMEAVREAYETQIRPEFKELAETGIDRLAKELSPSVELDQIRYRGERSTFMPEASYEEHVEYLKDYIETRLGVMDQFLLSDEGKNQELEPLKTIDKEAGTAEAAEQEIEEESESTESMTLATLVLTQHGWLALGALFAMLLLLFVLSFKNSSRKPERK